MLYDVSVRLSVPGRGEGSARAIHCLLVFLSFFVHPKFCSHPNTSTCTVLIIKPYKRFLRGLLHMTSIQSFTDKVKIITQLQCRNMHMRCMGFTFKSGD